MTLECWVDLWPKELVECCCGSCCPEVQLLLKAQTGFDASFLVGWMGNVGCEKEPSILHRTAWPSTHALHQNNQAFACQPGWEWEEWPGMWLVSESQRTQMRIWERMQNSRGGKKKNAAAFVVKEDFLYCQTARALVIPSNILQESGKIWKNTS